MKNYVNKTKKFVVIGIVVVNIFAVGAVTGAVQGYNYAKDQSHTIQTAVEKATKTPVVQASSK